jgi:hypothetical protein
MTLAAWRDAPKISPVTVFQETVCVEDQLVLAVESEQESDDETTDSMPDLLPRVSVLKSRQASPIKTTEESADEEESGDDSDDESDVTDDSLPKLLPSVSPVKQSVPKEVDIANKGETESSFASDAEGSGEIAAVLGETLDRVAQAIDDLNLDLDCKPLTEQKEIVVQADAKDKEGFEEDEISNISQSAEDDDCDSWNMVADDDN